MGLFNLSGNAIKRPPSETRQELNPDEITVCIRIQNNAHNKKLRNPSRLLPVARTAPWERRTNEIRFQNASGDRGRRNHAFWRAKNFCRRSIVLQCLHPSNAKANATATTQTKSEIREETGGKLLFAALMFVCFRGAILAFARPTLQREGVT